MVHNKFEKDWHHYLSCSLKYIVVVVDGRGTGFKGRKLRNPVRGNLGHYEVIDQVNAARYVYLFSRHACLTIQAGFLTNQFMGAKTIRRYQTDWDLGLGERSSFLPPSHYAQTRIVLRRLHDLESDGSRCRSPYARHGCRSRRLVADVRLSLH
jgi:hypothetical protein